MRLILAFTAMSIISGTLLSANAEEAVKPGDRATAEELAQVKQMVEKLSVRIERLERRLETKSVAKKATDKILLSRTYRVIDLVPAIPGGTLELDHLKRYITTHIAPQQWEGAGGLGTINVYVQNLSLVITQTEEVHAEISQRLSRLREAKALLHEFDQTRQPPDPPVKATALNLPR